MGELINFALHPVEEVASFGGDRPRLHWFGLTDGYYWLDVGGAELFRYRDEFLSDWGSDKPPRPYVDYNLARLWEDLLPMTPVIVEPLPAPLARRLASAASWHGWERRVRHWRRSSKDDDEDLLVEQATRWWYDRCFDTSHLRHGPWIWLWRDAEQVWIGWDNRRRMHRGRPVWTATTGRRSMPVERFVAEVRSFHARLMQAMAARVEAARAHWPRPDVALDVAALAEEQTWREEWGDSRLAAIDAGTATDWDAALAAVATLEARYPTRTAQGTTAHRGFHPAFIRRTARARVVSRVRRRTSSMRRSGPDLAPDSRV